LRERLSDTFFTAAFVIVPRVIEEVDAAIETFMNEANCFVFLQVSFAEVRSSEADRRNLFACCTKVAVEHFALHGAWVSDTRDTGGGLAGSSFG
jgi:hypothetical protein